MTRQQPTPCVMPLSHANHQVIPPEIDIPHAYNAAADLLGRHSHHPEKPAYIDASSGKSLSYAALNEQSHRFAQGLLSLGLQPEQRVLLCMHDGLPWPVVFLGCLLAGVVPVAVNTLLTSQDYLYMLQDSRARALLVSDALWPVFAPVVDASPDLTHIVSDEGKATPKGLSVASLIAHHDPLPSAAPTLSDDVCFWLYSSGSTGSPKGTVHLHSHLIQTGELYGRGVLGLREDDVVFSAAKLFFAYGLGNALINPKSIAKAGSQFNNFLDPGKPKVTDPPPGPQVTDPPPGPGPEGDPTITINMPEQPGIGGAAN